MYNESNNQLGLPLLAPSKQTILPIICGGNGNLQGFFTIASTTFAGTETTFALAEGSVAIKSVTLPSKVRDGNFGVQQYMAAVYDDSLILKRPWIGYSSWVDTNHTGYDLVYYQPVTGWMSRYNRGILITNLSVNMAAQSMSAPVTSPPTVSNGTIRWVASMAVNSSQLECGFFDFNWVELFNAQTTGVDPLSLTIVSNPAGGAFKSTLVPSPIIAPLGGVQFNTVRIIKLATAAAGAYVFTYSVTDTNNNTTTCTLTLTLV